MSRPLLPNPFLDDRLTDADAFDERYDVPTLHQTASAYLIEAIERAPKQKQPDGKAKVAVILSAPGLGKTHVIGRVQHHFGDRAVVVFVPQVEEHGSPIKHVQWHVLKKLFGAQPERRPLIHTLLAQLCQHSFRRYFDALPHTVKAKHKSLRDRLDGTSVDAALEIVNETKEPSPFLALAKSIALRCAALDGDAIRGLVLGWSPCKDEVWKWLRGDQVDEKRLAELQLPLVPPTTTALLKTLTGLLHRLQIPLVICCDQSEKLLKWPSAMNDLTTAMMGWVDQIPNLVLGMTFLKDEWKKLNESFKSFCDRTYQLHLDTLQPAQGLELIRKRMAGWPGAKAGKGRIWPFAEERLFELVSKKPLDARGLLKMYSAGLEKWLVQQSDEAGIDEGQNAPLEELFRQEWNRTLQGIRKELLAADNLQEERLFRAVHEALNQVQAEKAIVAGMDLLQIQDSAMKGGLALQLKLGVKGSNAAVPVVMALTKLTSGNPLTNFFKNLEEATTKLDGAVLVRPTSRMTLGAKAVGREIFDRLKTSKKVRVYDLNEHRTAFEQMECYLRLLDRAVAKELQLGQKIVGVEGFRQLVARTKSLEGLDFFDTVFAGWVTMPAQIQTIAKPVVAKASPAPTPASPGVGASPKPVAVAVQKPSPAAVSPAPSRGDEWANQLLRAVANKLNEFGQKVEPIGVKLGPTFVRLMLKPFGKTYIGKVRNHANDLRTHIAMIQDVPIISDLPGYISVDVRRPDRQTVHLEACLKSETPDLAKKPAFPVGVDVAGKPHWLNLAEPATCHILAAGTTGSGKSEFLKAMIAGLAARLSPLELQFVLIDPKRVTFNFPGRSPYFLHPIAHTAEEAMPLVQECFAETVRRYEVLQSKGLEHVGQLKGADALSRIVVIFDEFADLMADQETKRELEGSLKRIGALARAAGIHLVLATQRPDKDVVTPLLKTNLPAKICLRVGGERDSKIILDEEGGENLLGNGDLFWKHGSGMIRLQGAYVPKAELEKVLRVEVS